MTLPQTLWAPWRGAYVGGERKPGCPFCSALKGEGDNLVIARSANVFAMMNLYPYAPGHLMVLPNRHTGAMEALSCDESAALWSLAVRAKLALEKLYRPDGFNVGINLGKAAGAGVAEHMHIHVVPRWEGDNNFMPVLAGARVISKHIEDTANDLRKALEDV